MDLEIGKTDPRKHRWTGEGCCPDAMPLLRILSTLWDILEFHYQPYTKLSVIRDYNAIITTPNTGRSHLARGLRLLQVLAGLLPLPGTPARADHRGVAESKNR